MRNLRWAALGLATVASLAMAPSAFAADIYNAQASLRSGASPSPAYNWSGFYAGAVGSYDFGSFVSTSSPPSTTDKVGAKGGSGGIEGGYNVVLGQFVVGGFANYNFASDSGSTITKCIPIICGFTGTVTNGESLTSYGTVQGRLGFLVMPSLLLYGQGGAAYGTFKGTTTTGGPLLLSSSSTDQRYGVGWAAGLGAEWMFAQNWSAKLEYDYSRFNLDKSNAGISSGSIDYAVQKIKTGVFYHF